MRTRAGFLCLASSRMSRTFTKPARTHREQLALLRSRGMEIGNEASALLHLRHINYYRLRAYWLPYEQPAADGDHAFKSGTRFDDIVDIYGFDRKLRLMVMDAIERVEVSIRTAWAYQIAHRYGPHGYTDSAAFRDGGKHKDCLNALKAELGRSHETFVRHYRDTYTTPKLPPVWVVCEVVSFSALSGWYANLRDGEDRKAIAEPYGIDEQVLESVIHHLVYLRNLCAHHSRLWNREATIGMKLAKRPAALRRQFNPDRPKRIFNSLVMLGFLLDRISPGSGWRTRVVHLVAEHPELDLDAMGFVSDWRARLLAEPEK